MADSSMDALFRAQEQALAGMSEAWELMLRGTARSPVPGAPGVGEGVQKVVEALATLAGNAAGPMLELVDGQRELAERLERWAELQRETAEVISALAKQQKLTADLLGATIAPFDRRPSGGT